MLVAGREMDALAGTIAGEDVLASMLDGGGADRRAEVAGPRDVVLAPEDEPRRHRVLGEVWMGPFVDLVRIAVPPVLQELGGRSGVVDLVEVHLVGLGEAEHAQAERGQQEHDHQPHVEAVQPAATLADQRATPVGPHGPLGQPVADPADDAHFRKRGAVAPRGQGRRR